MDILWSSEGGSWKLLQEDPFIHAALISQDLHQRPGSVAVLLTITQLAIMSP